MSRPTSTKTVTDDVQHVSQSADCDVRTTPAVCMVSTSLLRLVWRLLSGTIRRCTRRAQESATADLCVLAEFFHGRAAWLFSYQDDRLVRITDFNSQMRLETISCHPNEQATCWRAIRQKRAIFATSHEPDSFESRLAPGLCHLALPLLDHSENAVGIVYILFEPREAPMTQSRLRDGRWKLVADRLPSRLSILGRSPGNVMPPLPFVPGRPQTFRKLARRLCDAISRSVDRNRVQCMLWAVDHKHRQLSLVATTGYDQEYKSNTFPQSETMLGELTEMAPGEVHLVSDLRTHGKFRRKDKALPMGLQRGCIVTIGHGSASRETRYLLVIYEFEAFSSVRGENSDWGTVAFPSDDTLRTIGSLWADLALEYEEATISAATALMQSERITSCPAGIEPVADAIRRLLGADGCYINFQGSVHGVRPYACWAGLGEESIRACSPILELHRDSRRCDETPLDLADHSLQITVDRSQCTDSQGSYPFDFRIMSARVQSLPMGLAHVHLIRRRKRPPFGTSDENILRGVMHLVPGFYWRAHMQAADVPQSSQESESVVPTATRPENRLVNSP